MKSDKHFFSYSRKDSSEFVLKLASDLKANGFNIWLDQQDITGGEVWDTEIQNALTQAECIIIVLSAASVNSPNVLDEMSYALKLGKPIYPVLKDDCDIPFRIDRIQRIDFRKDYDTGLVQLIKTLDQTVTPIITPTKKISKKIILYLLIGLAILSAGLYFILRKPGDTDKIANTLITDSIAAINNRRIALKKPHAEVVLFATTDYKTSYQIVDTNLVLTIYSPDFIPSLFFDVNQNKLSDSGVDRTYGITSGSINILCAQYFLSNNTRTPCGIAPTAASLALRDNVFTFTLPVNEITTAAAVTISFQLVFYNYATGRVFFPARNDFINFNHTYIISI